MMTLRMRCNSTYLVPVPMIPAVARLRSLLTDMVSRLNITRQFRPNEAQPTSKYIVLGYNKQYGRE